MPSLRASLYGIYSLEESSNGDSPLHRIDARAKIIGTFVYILSIISFGRGEVSSLAPYVIYPAVAIPLADIPAGIIFRRILLALPFCIFAGISSAFFDRTPLFSAGGVNVTMGYAICLSIIFRAALCVCAVLILIAATPFRELTRGLRRMHVPNFIVTLFEMTYRYAGTLMEDAVSLYTAYSLRSGAKKGVEMRDMGTFVGQLLLRSADRAERVYRAMKCRGYPGVIRSECVHGLRRSDYLFPIFLCGTSLFFRFVNVPLLIGGFFYG